MLGGVMSEIVAREAASVAELIDWPSPSPLEGVKSRQRNIFQVESAEVFTSKESVKVCNLALSLSSRVIAVGDPGHAAAELLLDSSCCSVKHPPGLKVLHLAPSSFTGAETASGYAHAISSAMIETKPHIVILSESESSGDAAWEILFTALIHGQGMWKFRGAVIVCAATESCSAQRNCSELWIGELGHVRQWRCLQICENALANGAEMLREDARRIDYCDLAYWIDKATAGNWKVTRFDAGCPEGAPSLRGLIFHHMIDVSAEFHVRFIFVPEEHRRQGLGERLVRWVIQDAAGKPQSDCRWISLAAADDELVAWYEKFGFTDMSCGHYDGDNGQTRMEMPSVSNIKS